MGAVTADKVIVELQIRDTQYNSRLKSNEREFKRSMDTTERVAEATARDIKRTMGQVPDDLRLQYRGLGEDIGRSFAGASRAAQLAFLAIAGYAINAARRAEDINDAFAFTFSEIGDDADKAAVRISDSFNRTAVQVKEGLNNAYQILTGVGADSATAFAASQALVERSIDLASQKGISDARAYEAIISGLTGETEPLKRLGVVLNEAAVKAELVRMGFKGNAESATDAQKQVARLNLILAKTSTAQGDVARTADSANNKLKEAQTEFQNAAVALGNELLPAFVAVTEAATDTLRAFNELPSGVQVTGLAFLGLIAASGPIAGLLANLARVIKLAKETRAALILAGVGGAGAGGLAALGTGVGIGAATLTLSGSSSEQGAAIRNRNLPADQQLRNAESGLAALRRQTRPGQGRTQQQQDQVIAQAEREVERLKRVAVIGRGIDELLGDGGAESPGVVGGFSLPAGGGTGTGTGGGRTGGGSSAASAEADARRRSRLEDEARLIAIQATGNDRLIKQEEERQRLADLTAQYQEAGYADAVARATEVLANENQIVQLAEQKDRLEKEAQDRAERMRNERERALTAQQRQYDLELEIARARGDDVLVKSLEREAEMRERIAAAVERYGPLAGTVIGFSQQRTVDEAEEEGVIRADATFAASTFIDALRSDDIWGTLGQKFAEGAAENLTKSLADLLTTLATQSNGSGSFLSSALGFIGGAFGGGRAIGGPVRAGFSYDVGENGREKFVAPSDGYIVPNMKNLSAPAGGSGMAFSFSPIYNVTGYGQDIESLKQQMAADRRGFRNNVAAAVNDGVQRRKIRSV